MPAILPRRTEHIRYLWAFSIPGEKDVRCLGFMNCRLVPPLGTGII